MMCFVLSGVRLKIKVIYLVIHKMPSKQGRSLCDLVFVAETFLHHHISPLVHRDVCVYVG